MGIQNKWEFRGNVQRFEARLVAKGSTNKKELIFIKLFHRSQARISSEPLWILFLTSIKLHQMDVKTVFLNGHSLKRPTYLNLKVSKWMVKNIWCELERSTCGLKQVSRLWFVNFNQVVTCFGFFMHQCIYLKVSGVNHYYILSC